jgi:hypothetical protein
MFFLLARIKYCFYYLCRDSRTVLKYSVKREKHVSNENVLSSLKDLAIKEEEISSSFKFSCWFDLSTQRLFKQKDSFYEQISEKFWISFIQVNELLLFQRRHKFYGIEIRARWRHVDKSTVNPCIIWHVKLSERI